MTEWKPIQDKYVSCAENISWTISTVDEPGWATDMGFTGYGLPYEVAKWICDTLNESNKICPFTQDKYGEWVIKYD